VKQQEIKEKKVYTEEQTRKYEEKRAKQKERQKAKKKELKEAKLRDKQLSGGTEKAEATGEARKSGKGELVANEVDGESKADLVVDDGSLGGPSSQNAASGSTATASSSANPVELSIKGRAEKADPKKKKPVKSKGKDVSRPYHQRNA